MQSALEFIDVKRSFGRVAAVNGLNFSIPDGAVAAFVGANGAGKTTTFSLIGQFLKLDSGSIRVFGTTLAEYRQRGGAIGLLPQDMQYFEERSVGRQLDLFARLGGLTAIESEVEVERVLRLTKLLDKQSAKAGELSHGMRVRLGVAQALIGKPKLILLDEPTAGLDPRMQAEFRNVVETVRGQTTLVISSHNLIELQELCDYCCMIDKGQLIKQGPMQQILNTGSARLRISLGTNDLELSALRQMMPLVSFDMADTGFLSIQFNHANFSVAEVNRQVLGWLLHHNVPVLEVREQKSLEDTFLDATAPKDTPS